MRVIAGSARGLPLRTLPGRQTRPTTDRIKETLFNMLSPYLEGATFLDLFAGSGQIGLEALSRGAREATFVEQDRKACACIQQNIDFTGFAGKSEVLCMDVLAAIDRLERGRVGPFDLIFLDPPYEKELERRVLERLSGSPLVAPEALLVVEASLRTDFSYVGGLGYEAVKQKKYKTNAHVFLRPFPEGAHRPEDL